MVPRRAHPHRAVLPSSPSLTALHPGRREKEVVFLFDGTEVVLVLNLLVRWESQEPAVTPDLGPPEARQGVPPL